MLNILGINQVEIAFTKGKVMNGIEKVCFARTVIPNKTIDLIRKQQCGITVILEISYGKFLQVHLSQLSLFLAETVHIDHDGDKIRGSGKMIG